MANIPDEPELNAARKLARCLPKQVANTFTVLLEAYLKKLEADEERLFETTNGKDVEALRSRIALLRNFLEGVVFWLPDGRPCEFEIPFRRPYHLQECATVWMRLLWDAHVHHSHGVLIHTYERLFFRYRNGIYVRDVKVNRADELPKIATVLGLPAASLSPSMHYISSGELRGAIALQNFFLASLSAPSRQHKRVAKLSTSSELLSDNETNLILLGAARMDAFDLRTESYEKFKVSEGGVRPRFNDRTESTQRVVYVLMSRRHGDGDALRTVFESSHGRAIQAVCERLTDVRSNLCRDVVAGLPYAGDTVPKKFQVVFKVVLTTDSTFVARANYVETVKHEFYV